MQDVAYAPVPAAGILLPASPVATGEAAQFVTGYSIALRDFRFPILSDWECLLSMANTCSLKLGRHHGRYHQSDSLGSLVFRQL